MELSLIIEGYNKSDLWTCFCDFMFVKPWENEENHTLRQLGFCNLPIIDVMKDEN